MSQGQQVAPVTASKENPMPVVASNSFDWVNNLKLALSAIAASGILTIAAQAWNGNGPTPVQVDADGVPIKPSIVIVKEEIKAAREDLKKVIETLETIKQQTTPPAKK